MLAKVISFGIAGLSPYPISVEVDVSRGVPGTVTVGLPDNAVKESKERVRSAIRNSGYAFGPHRITINLSPADIKKEGPSFDLPIAIAFLMASKQLPAVAGAETYVILGELALDGRVRPVHGVLPIALQLRQQGFSKIIIPYENRAEAAIAHDIEIYPVKTLGETVFLLTDQNAPAPFHAEENLHTRTTEYDIDFAEVKGQYHVKRGLEIAAAGGHNCLMIGAPGTGKSMLAKRLPTILPDMTYEEAVETTTIHSAMGMLTGGNGLLKARPFRAPHHTTSSVAIVGGGSQPKPGEATLSHNGVLFLDELPEFTRAVLESLRQPLEDHQVTVARAIRTVCFPAHFMLICAMNPCPCGFYGDRRKRCQCSSAQIQKYLSKISGPLLDRIDIHLEVPALPPTEILSRTPAEQSRAIKERTIAARSRQRARLKNTGLYTNAQMGQKHIETFCTLSNDCRDIIRSAIDELNLSARAYDKIIKVSRTIADLAECDEIKIEHIAEAIQYRSLDRNFF